MSSTGTVSDILLNPWTKLYCTQGWHPQKNWPGRKMLSMQMLNSF